MTTTLLMVMGVPTAVTAFCFWLIERNISNRDKIDEQKRLKRQADVDERDKKRLALMYLLTESVDASVGLSEAIAKAVERIPDANCNGDMHDALTQADKARKEQKSFLEKQGIENVFGDIAKG